MPSWKETEEGHWGLLWAEGCNPDPRGLSIGVLAMAPAPHLWLRVPHCHALFSPH